MRRNQPVGKARGKIGDMVSCLFCEGQFKRTLDNDKFCKRACYRDYALLHGDNYRAKALRFLPHQCQKCAVPLTGGKKIVVHHQDENRMNNALENLVILCNPCHNKIHQHLVLESQKAYGDRAIQRGVIEILKGLKLDLNDKNLQATPNRVSRMFYEMFEGLFRKDEVEQILATTFPSEYQGIICHQNILVFSMCPHHLLPVEYDISVAYISKRTVGLSKLPRVIELLAKRPILQETLTFEIADALTAHLQASGVMVIARGKHSCMRIRGVKTLTDMVITSEIRGLFKNDASAKAEAVHLLGQG